MLPADMEQLSHLRRAIAKSEALPEEVRPLALGITDIDAALGGGLTRATLHELSATSLHLGAAAGFALTLAALASEQAKQTLWIATDFGMIEILEHIDSDMLVRQEANDRAHPVDAAGMHPHLLSRVVVDEPPEPVAEEVGFREL